MLMRKIHRFLADRRGNVAPIFALALIPLLGLIGAAVDYSRANKARTAMQTALDATALAMAQSAGGLNATDLQTTAKNYFLALYKTGEATNVNIQTAYSTTNGFSLTITGTGTVKSDFMNLMGINTINIAASSTSAWGNTRLRVALVLDNTGSMADDGKMTALKTATKNLLTQLKNAATTNGDVYVSIIPFSKDVNVGSTYYNATWIDWTDWNSNNQTCSGWGGWGWGGGGGSCTANNHNTWNGCITDRGNSGSPSSSNYDQNVAAPVTGVTASMYAAEQYSNCSSQMKGLSYDWTSMTSIVDGMTPNGNTNQGIGLVWGWLSLAGGGPLTVPAMDSNYTYTQVIILLTDGLNTQNRWSSSQSTIDKRMYDSTNNGSGTCKNIKAAGITLYTIQVNTGNDPTSTLLKNCASSTDKFFLLTTANQIVTTFQAIGTNLSKLRVAK